MATYALKEPLGSKRMGEDRWFRMMTPIGPCTTGDPSERAEYPTRLHALDAPCWRHPLTFWEIEEVSGSDA